MIVWHLAFCVNCVFYSFYYTSDAIIFLKNSPSFLNYETCKAKADEVNAKLKEIEIFKDTVLMCNPKD